MLKFPVTYTRRSVRGENYKAMKASQIIVTFLATLFLSASSDMQFAKGHMRIGGIGEISEISRERSSFFSVAETTLMEAAEQIIDILGKDNLEQILGVQPGLYAEDVSTASLVRLWSNLPANTKEMILTRMYPFLIPSSAGDRWTLHCAVSRELCMGDSNCSWKYNKFLSQCSKDESNILDRMKSDRTTSRHPERRRRRKSKASRKRSVKRDVQMVRKRIKTEARISRRRKRKNKTEAVFWMGNYLRQSKSARSANMLRYFSLETKSSKCSSQCVQVLDLLNFTIYGALLAHCDCRAKTMPKGYKAMLYDSADISKRSTQSKQDYLKLWENRCVAHQKIAQVCRPRLFVSTKGVMGCTEVHRRCNKDPKCKEVQHQFFIECSKAMTGDHCSLKCRESIKLLRNTTSKYDSCVCDGREGPHCSVIRKNIKKVCESENSHSKEHISRAKSKSKNSTPCSSNSRTRLTNNAKRNSIVFQYNIIAISVVSVITRFVR